MHITFYLPYYDYNDGAFDVDKNYYNDEEYAKAMSEEYNRNKDIIYNSMMDFKNGSRGLFEDEDGKVFKFGQKTSQSEDKVAYSKCNGTLYDIGGEKDTVDGLISKFSSQKSFLEIIDFDFDSIEEEFESELSLWVREHNKINKYGEKLGEDWVLSNEPKRSLRLCFKNNANEDIYAVFEGCKIMDITEENSFILFIERIRLIDKFI